MGWFRVVQAEGEPAQIFELCQFPQDYGRNGLVGIVFKNAHFLVPEPSRKEIDEDVRIKVEHSMSARW